MCYEMWEPVFIYTAKELDSSTGLSVGVLLKSNEMIRSYDIPHFVFTSLLSTLLAVSLYFLVVLIDKVPFMFCCLL